MAFCLAMLMFVAGFAAWQLGLVWLASVLYPLATKIILLAFGVLFLLGVGLLIRVCCRNIVLYFRREAMAMRRVIMLQVRQRDAKQRLMLEKRQIYYLNQLKRQRLLAANNKQHSRELFNAISVELKGHDGLPGGEESLHKSLKQHHSQANPEAMLALRDQVLCRY